MTAALLHYTRKTDIEFSRITGAKVPSLCGDYGPAEHPGGPKSPNSKGAPICPECTRRMAVVMARTRQEVTA